MAGLAWGWWEAGWLRRRILEVPLARLPAELDGLRIAHLSDFHLGMPGRGARAVREAGEWTAARAPDLVAITGDLVSHPSGVAACEAVLERLPGAYVVLGNHDLGVSRDPFSRGGAVPAFRGVTLLGDEATTLELRGRRVQLAGVDARSYPAGRARPARLADPQADLRILLCHFPGVARRLPDGSFDLVLAGHLHAGQITLPRPGGRVLLAHPGAREHAGLYRYGDRVLHVSPGLGTSFVPFRFFARPEVTELVLRSPAAAA